MAGFCGWPENIGSEEMEEKDGKSWRLAIILKNTMVKL
jgi:hypothetical protein